MQPPAAVALAGARAIGIGLLERRLEAHGDTHRPVAGDVEVAHPRTVSSREAIELGGRGVDLGLGREERVEPALVGLAARGGLCPADSLWLRGARVGSLEGIAAPAAGEGVGTEVEEGVEQRARAGRLAFGPELGAADGRHCGAEAGEARPVGRGIEHEEPTGVAGGAIEGDDERHDPLPGETFEHEPARPPPEAQILAEPQPLGKAFARRQAGQPQDGVAGREPVAGNGPRR